MAAPTDDRKNFMSTPIQPQSAITLATDIVAAYVSNNSVPEDKLTDLIKQVHRTVRDADSETAGAAAGTEKPTAAQIRKSITEDALISFIDGKPYKTLKRHLTLKGLTPDQYKLKYGLPPDYPMIASSYSKQRSDLAKMLGLGQRGRAASQAEAKIDEIASEPIGTTAAAPVEMPAEESKTTRRGSRRRAAAAGEQATAPKKPSRTRRASAAEEATAETAPATPKARTAKSRQSASEEASNPGRSAKGATRKASGKSRAKASRTKSGSAKTGGTKSSSARGARKGQGEVAAQTA